MTTHTAGLSEEMLQVRDTTRRFWRGGFFHAYSAAVATTVALARARSRASRQVI